MATVEAPQRIFTCINCQTQMRLDPSMRRVEDADEKKTDPDTQDGLEGQSKNLFNLLCEVKVPSHAPICRECSDELMRDMEQQLNSLEEECKSYKNLIADLNSNHCGTDLSTQKQDLRNRQDEERRLENELQKLLLEEKQLDAEHLHQKKTLELASSEELHLWRVFRDNHRRLLDIWETTSRVDSELRYAEKQNSRLAGINVLDLCFHIWVDGDDGTIGEINGFRLGRLPNRPVDWPEINAAWGQAVLLLDVLMQRSHVRQDTYELMAMGSHSAIKVKRSSGEVQTIPLSGSGSWKPFGNNNIDSGIVAFLLCFDTVCAALKVQYPNFKLQYRMNKDRLVHEKMEYVAKMLLNSEERWTKAMKMLLVNLKTTLVQVVAIRPPT